MNSAKQYYFGDNPNIKFFNGKYEALDNVSATHLITEWKEFRSPDFDEITEKMGNKIIFDGRNQYNKNILRLWVLNIIRLVPLMIYEFDIQIVYGLDYWC